MSGMGEVFGKRDRPQSLDFWKLSAIVLKLDGRMEAATDKEATWIATVTEHVDLESITYLAAQRAIRALAPTPENRVMLAKMAAMYIDGFITGAEYAKERP